MAATSGRTGRAGSVSLSAIVINITGWSAKLNINFADSTDSGNYSAPNLFDSQLNGSQHVEGSIKGFYDASNTATNLDGVIKVPSSGPYATVLKIDASTTWFSGNCDFTDIEYSLEVPGATMVTFSANFKSNGAYTTLN